MQADKSLCQAGPRSYGAHSPPSESQPRTPAPALWNQALRSGRNGSRTGPGRGAGPRSGYDLDLSTALLLVSCVALGKFFTFQESVSFYKMRMITVTLPQGLLCHTHTYKENKMSATLGPRHRIWVVSFKRYNYYDPQITAAQHPKPAGLLSTSCVTHIPLTTQELQDRRQSRVCRPC